MEQSTSGHKSLNLHRYLLSSPRYWNIEEKKKRAGHQQERYQKDLETCREEHQRYDQLVALAMNRIQESGTEGAEHLSKPGVEEVETEAIEAEGSFFTTQETPSHLESLSFVHLSSARASRLEMGDHSRVAEEESIGGKMSEISGLTCSSLSSSSHSFLRVPSRPESRTERSHKSPRKKYS
jgi:hypothetical protein